jgi:hypothetical protein
MLLRHDTGRDQPVQLPRSAAVRLKTWYTLEFANVPRCIQTLPDQTRVYDLFTDATLGGWGAVYVDSRTKRAVISGSCWGVGVHNISGAETWAVSYVFAAFQDFLQPGAKVHLHIDHTLALSAVTKGAARSYAINVELHEYLTGLPYHVSGTYITSADSPAHIAGRPSAVPHKKWEPRDMGAGNR